MQILLTLTLHMTGADSNVSFTSEAVYAKEITSLDCNPTHVVSTSGCL